MVVVTRDTDVTTKIGEFNVKNSREENLLDVKIDQTFLLQKGKPRVTCTSESRKFYGSSKT